MTTESELVVLVGFMGAGKTTVGRELSRVLNWSATTDISRPPAIHKLDSVTMRISNPIKIFRIRFIRVIRGQLFFF